MLRSDSDPSDFQRDLDWILSDLYHTYFYVLQPVFKEAETIFEHLKRSCHNCCFSSEDRLFVPVAQQTIRLPLVLLLVRLKVLEEDTIKMKLQIVKSPNEEPLGL